MSPRKTVHIYAQGFVCCSVCAPGDIPVKEVESVVNAINPTGIESPWRLSEDEAFRDGSKNPHPCEQSPDRSHYLMSC